jgi:hypothetical protein
VKLETKEAREGACASACASAYGRFLAIGLEPPGNIVRELSLFKRRFFSRLGDPAALAFPDCAVLAFGARPPRSSARIGRSNQDVARLRARALSLAWEGIDPHSAFSIGAPGEGEEPEDMLETAGSALFLRFRGPLLRLAENAEAFFRAIGIPALEDPPFAAGRGCFLCAEGSDASRIAAVGARPPSEGFRDCSLVLWSFAVASESFRASSWKELARVRRPSVRARGSPCRSDFGRRISPS